MLNAKILHGKISLHRFLSIIAGSKASRHLQSAGGPSEANLCNEQLKLKTSKCNNLQCINDFELQGLLFTDNSFNHLSSTAMQ